MKLSAFAEEYKKLREKIEVMKQLQARREQAHLEHVEWVTQESFNREMKSLE